MPRSRRWFLVAICKIVSVIIDIFREVDVDVPSREEDKSFSPEKKPE